MTEESLGSYSNSIKQLKLSSHRYGITEDEFKSLYLETLKEIQEAKITESQSNLNLILRRKKIIICILMLIVILCNGKGIYTILMCNLQEYIYPGLRLLRRITIPIISLFPSLTEFYDETCLIHNPFFTVKDMDCWPCSTVTNVRQVTDPDPAMHLNNAPFTYETEQKSMDIKVLKELYERNKHSFDLDTPKVLVNNKYDVSPGQMFESLTLGLKNQLYIWKFNNMALARILRQIISRPKIVPKHGQSPERFIIIDTSQKVFMIPDTECHYSFLLFLKGSRNINLMPSEECKQECKPLKVNLKESHLLWYNWWYWRPTIQPSQQNDTLIAQLGSYC